MAAETTERAERILAAAEAAFARLSEAAQVIEPDAPNNIFGPLGETVFWTVALDDTLRKALAPDYEATRNADGAGRLIAGLQHARNKITHGLDVTTTSTLYGGSMLGLMVLDVGRLNTLPEHQWKADLPTSRWDDPDQKKPYDEHLAGVGVLPTIRAALDYLREVVERSDQ